MATFVAVWTRFARRCIISSVCSREEPEGEITLLRLGGLRTVLFCWFRSFADFYGRAGPTRRGFAAAESL